MNILQPERKLAVLSALCSIRATLRMTGVHKTTTRLLVETGGQCAVL